MGSRICADAHSGMTLGSSPRAGLSPQNPLNVSLFHVKQFPPAEQWGRRNGVRPSARELYASPVGELGSDPALSLHEGAAGGAAAEGEAQADLELMREDGLGAGEQESQNENDYPEAFLETPKKESPMAEPRAERVRHDGSMND